MKGKLKRIEEEIRRIDMNLYGFALTTDEGTGEISTQKCNTCNDSYSVTKAYIATAAGMLWERGVIDLDEPVTDVLREWKPQDEKWKRVTLRHALGHTMGIGRGYLDIDVEDIWSYGTTDFLEVLFREPLAYEPGTHEQYSDAAYYLASRVIEARAGEAADSFVMREMMIPMKVREAAWSRCPMNHPIGATGLYIRASDMVKLGWAYVDGGVYGGKRLFTQRWIEEERKGGLAFRRRGEGLFAKGGMYGQMLMFSPEQRFAAAWHSFTADRRADGLPEFIEKIMK